MSHAIAFEAHIFFFRAFLHSRTEVGTLGPCGKNPLQDLVPVAWIFSCFIACLNQAMQFLGQFSHFRPKLPSSSPGCMRVWTLYVCLWRASCNNSQCFDTKLSRGLIYFSWWLIFALVLYKVAKFPLEARQRCTDTSSLAGLFNPACLLEKWAGSRMQTITAASSADTTSVWGVCCLSQGYLTLHSRITT